MQTPKLAENNRIITPLLIACDKGYVRVKIQHIYGKN